MTSKPLSAGGHSRLVSLAATVGSLGLLAVVIFMLWPADPLDTAGVDGETVGWVSKVESNTIHVNSGPFGSGVVPLVITRNTRIMVGSREGWFEDIRPGGQVRVVYQTVHGNRLARSVDLLVADGPRRPTRIEPRVKGASGDPAGGRVPARAAVGTSPPAADPKPAGAPSKGPASTPGEARPGPGAEHPRAQATEAPAGRGGTSGGRASAESGARTAEPARLQPAVTPPAPGARPGEAPRLADGESADGAAAVDWLLKNRR